MENCHYLEVDSIIDKRLNSEGDVEFLIHWRGLDDFYNSWEPLANLTNIKWLIANYEKTQLEHNQNYIIENEVKALLANDNYNDINEISNTNDDNLPKPSDVPLRIISLSRNESESEIYAFIEWQVRSKTGVKPKNSYLSTKRFKKEKKMSLFYLTYLENNILIHNNKHSNTLDNNINETN